MFRNNWSLSALTSGSLCGIYSSYYSRLIILKRSPHCGSDTLDSVLASLSAKVEGWTKYFSVVVLMKGSTLGAYSNYFAILGEEPSPISTYLIFGALSERLVVGFLGDILAATREDFRDCVRNWMTYINYNQ
jgi:hypothetical protein